MDEHDFITYLSTALGWRLRYLSHVTCDFSVSARQVLLSFQFKDETFQLAEPFRLSSFYELRSDVSDEFRRIPCAFVAAIDQILCPEEFLMQVA